MLPEGIDDMILFPNRHFQEVTPDPSLPAFVIARLAAEAVMQVMGPSAGRRRSFVAFA